jgi:hypothetical protein
VPPERKGESGQTPGKPGEDDDSAAKPNQIEINSLGTLKIALENLTATCERQLENAEKGVFMRSYYFKIFQGIKNMLFEWVAREPEVQYPDARSTRNPELVQVLNEQISQHRAKQMDFESRISRQQYRNEQDKRNLYLSVVMEYVVMRDYQNRLFDLLVPKAAPQATDSAPGPAQRAAAAPRATDSEPGPAQRAAAAPQAREPDSGPAPRAAAGPEVADSGPAERKPSRGSKTPKLPERIPVDSRRRALTEDEMRRADELQENIDELSRIRRDQVPVLGHSFETLQKINPSTRESIFASGTVSFEKALQKFDQDSDNVYHTETELVRLRLARMRIIAADRKVVNDLIVFIQMRLASYREVLNQKIRQCPRDDNRDRDGIYAVLIKLDRFSGRLEEFSRSVLSDPDGVESRLTTERLHMLLDSPSLYKAWLLASTPEEECISGT